MAEMPDRQYTAAAILCKLFYFLAKEKGSGPFSPFTFIKKPCTVEKFLQKINQKTGVAFFHFAKRPTMGRFRIAIHTILFLTTFILMPSVVIRLAAAEEPGQPISIEANRMVSQENKNSVVFIGKVDARQGNLTIKTDEMTVFYLERKDGTTRGQQGDQSVSQVEKLICTGNVKVSQGDWLGVGNRMEYFAGERKAVLSGNAKAWQGQNMVSGKTIVYYLAEKRSVVEPDGNSRVRAIIHPESKKTP